MAQHIDPERLAEQLHNIFKYFGFEVTNADRMVYDDSVRILTGFDVQMHRLRMEGSRALEKYLQEFYDNFKNSPHSKDLEATYKMEADMLREELEELREQNNKLLEVLSDGMEALDE